MVVLGLAVTTPARQALRTAELLRAEVLRPVERDEHPVTEPLEGAQPTVPAQHVQALVEGGLQVRGRHWAEHSADMVVGRDSGHAEQALAVRRLPPVLQRALVGEEGFALQEEQRKGRQADIRHAVGHLAAPLVGKGRAGRANALQKGLEHLHADLNHTSGRSETYLKINHLELLEARVQPCVAAWSRSILQPALLTSMPEIEESAVCRPRS